jgi:hypothetical protein
MSLFDRCFLSEAMTMSALKARGHIRKTDDGGYEGVTPRGKEAIKSRSERAWLRAAPVNMGTSAARKQRLRGGKHAIELNPSPETIKKRTADSWDDRERAYLHLQRHGRYPAVYHDADYMSRVKDFETMPRVKAWAKIAKAWRQKRKELPYSRNLKRGMMHPAEPPSRPLRHDLEGLL